MTFTRKHDVSTVCVPVEQSSQNMFSVLVIIIIILSIDTSCVNDYIDLSLIVWGHRGQRSGWLCILIKILHGWSVWLVPFLYAVCQLLCVCHGCIHTISCEMDRAFHYGPSPDDWSCPSHQPGAQSNVQLPMLISYEYRPYVYTWRRVARYSVARSIGTVVATALGGKESDAL